MKNSIRCWSQPIREGCTHIMVVQDDVEVVNDFVQICNRIVQTFKRAIFVLHYRKITPKDRKVDSPFICLKNKNVAGQCVIMPKELVDGYIDFYRKHVKQTDYPHDDGAIRTYAWLNDIPVFSTIPALVNNLGTDSSVIDKSHIDRTATTKVWEGKNGAAEQEWSCKKYSVVYYPSYLQLPEFNEVIKQKRKMQYV